MRIGIFVPCSLLHLQSLKQCLTQKLINTCPPKVQILQRGIQCIFTICTSLRSRPPSSFPTPSLPSYTPALLGSFPLPPCTLSSYIIAFLFLLSRPSLLPLAPLPSFLLKELLFIPWCPHHHLCGAFSDHYR